MNHPNRICFACDVATPSSRIYRSRYSVELIDLMSMMNQNQRLACKGGHQYVAHFFHSGTVLLVGVVYFPEYIDDYELRLRCLKGLTQELVTFVRKDIKPGRIVLRVEEVQVIWELNTRGREVTKAFSPDSLARIELEIQHVRLSTSTGQEATTRRYRVGDL